MRKSVSLLSLLLFLLAPPAFPKEKFLKPGPIHLDRDGQKWAEKTLRKLSPEEKIGQLFMVRLKAEFLNDNDPYFLELRDGSPGNIRGAPPGERVVRLAGDW